MADMKSVSTSTGNASSTVEASVNESMSSIGCSVFSGDLSNISAASNNDNKTNITESSAVNAIALKLTTPVKTSNPPEGTTKLYTQQEDQFQTWSFPPEEDHSRTRRHCPQDINTDRFEKVHDEDNAAVGLSKNLQPCSSFAERGPMNEQLPTTELPKSSLKASTECGNDDTTLSRHVFKFSSSPERQACKRKPLLSRPIQGSTWKAQKGYKYRYPYLDDRPSRERITSTPQDDEVSVGSMASKRRSLKNGIKLQKVSDEGKNRMCESDGNKPTPSGKRKEVDKELMLQNKFKRRRYVPPSVKGVTKEEKEAVIKEIRKPNACFTDVIMDVILRLISLNFPEYFIPNDMKKFFRPNGVQPLHCSSEFAQVIFARPKSSRESTGVEQENNENDIGHFVLLTNIGCKKLFALCDSLGERSSNIRPNIYKIIRTCLGFKEAHIVVVQEKAMSVQLGNIYCGLYVVAALIDICLGNGSRLENSIYDQERMRSHLIDLINDLYEHRPISGFPIIDVDDEKRQSKLILI